MKDQYAGDFGDYVKLAILRRLAQGQRLAINWYRTPDDPTRRDGLHTEYLRPEQEGRWRHFDPPLYDHLRDMVRNGSRSISRLQNALLSDETTFFDRELRVRAERAPWFALFASTLPSEAILFLDPDNGIASPRFSGSIASVTCEEIEYLRGGIRTAIVYHHHTRVKGGHLVELEEIANRLASSSGNKPVCALRAANWSPRSFFIIGATRTIWNRAEVFARDWAPYVTFHALSPVPADVDASTSSRHDPYSQEAERRIELFADRLDTGKYDEVFGIGLAKPESSGSDSA